MADKTKNEKPDSKALIDEATRRKRNEQRVDRYRSDPEYRRTVKAQSRKTYQSQAGTELFDPRENLKKLDDFGKVRQTHMPTGSVQRWVFTKSEMAAVLGRTTKMFYPWLSDGRFPKPVIEAVDYPITRNYSGAKNVRVPATLGVYTVEEVRAAVGVLGDHLSKIAYYRKDHHGTRRALYAAMQAARRSMGLPDSVSETTEES